MPGRAASSRPPFSPSSSPSGLADAWSDHPASDLLSWDQAARAEQAVLLAKEARFLEAGPFIRRVLSLNWWPPFHALAAFPFVLVMGPTAATVVLPSLAAFVLAILAILYCYSGLFGNADRGEAVGLAFLFGLAATSPLFLSSATWVMLEVFGTGLTFFGYGAYFRARRTGEARDYRLCGLLLFALWLTKYYYGMGFGLTLLVFETLRFRPGLRAVLSGRKVFRGLARPVLFPAYGLLALICWIGATGGGRVSLLGASVSLTGIYNPVTYLYLYATAAGLLYVLRNRRRLAASLKPGQAALFAWGVVPTALFMALPDKIKAVIMNLEAGSRTPSPGLAARGQFYLKSLLRDHSLYVPLGDVVLALALGSGAEASAERLSDPRPGGPRPVRRDHPGPRLQPHGGPLYRHLRPGTLVDRGVGARIRRRSVPRRRQDGFGRSPGRDSRRLDPHASPIRSSGPSNSPGRAGPITRKRSGGLSKALVDMTRGARRSSWSAHGKRGSVLSSAGESSPSTTAKRTFRLFLEEPGPGGTTTDDFRALLDAGNRDRIVICLAGGGAERGPLREWARLLMRSGRYGKIGQASFNEPVRDENDRLRDAPVREN